MLLSPQAVRRLKDVTAYNNWPNTTHEQRNELARMFNEEAGRLLDQKAESTVKHVVELHSSGDITFERYIELIEEISREEETRGAAHGGEYARNRVFEFAQKALDRAKDRAHALQLSDAKRQYELEKRKTEQGLREVVQQGMVDVKTAVQQHDADLKATAHEQKAGLVQDQERLVAHTKTEIEQVILARLQEERARREREIHEEEAARPAREAARTAIARIADLEKQIRAHQRFKRGLMGLGWALLAALAIAILFWSLPQWGIALALVVSISIMVIAYLSRSPVAAENISGNQREIMLFQTGAGDYAHLGEKERCALLVQRMS